MLDRHARVYSEDSQEDLSNLNWKMEEVQEEDENSASSSKIDRNLANLVSDLSN